MATPDSPTRPTPRPLFTLDTLLPSDYILVDGEAHDLLRMDQLPLASFALINRLCPRFDELIDKPLLDEAEATELSDLVARISRVVVPTAPNERFTDEQRLQIVLTFIDLSRTPRLTRARIAAERALRTTATPSTGARSSRASAASTRARRPRRG